MQEVQKTKRGKAIYTKNPSVIEAISEQKTGIKRISNGSGEELILSNANTGEVYSGMGMGFHKSIKVDKTQFVKLYIKGVSMFVGLTKPGGRVLEMLIAESARKIGTDLVYLSPSRALEIYNIPKATYMRGLKDLIEKEVLFNTADMNWYFMNVNYLFNGDRLAFLQTYDLDKNTESDKARIPENPNQASLPFDI